MRVQRDNPVGVPFLVTGVGKPTVREAQFPSGIWMTKKRTPVAERRQEKRDRWPALRRSCRHNWPDTGLMPGPERVLTWSGGPVESDDD
jgi:hypothetical protein